MLFEISNFVTTYAIIPLAICSGIYLSIRFKFLQITKLKSIFLSMSMKKKCGSISSFSAVSAVIGGNLGVGNISGVAVALATGGPGALFWMWLIAILISTIKYAGCYLAVIFREKNLNGELVGGPMYYIHKGIKKPFIARIFCYMILLLALVVGNIVQMHSFLLPIKTFGLSPFFPGLLIALLVAGVIWGGMKRFVSVVSVTVPFMGIMYVGFSMLILLIHFDRLPYAIWLIFNSAFGLEQSLAGGIGFTVLMALRTGFDRVLFSTDIGLGLAPIIHASVDEHSDKEINAMQQGLVSILSPIIVVFVCTVTTLVLIVTGVWNTNYESTNMCIAAFQLGLNIKAGGNIIIIILFFFAFTTILTWLYCANRALEYLYGVNSKCQYIFQLIFVSLIPIGIYLQNYIVWGLADLLVNMMFIINTVSVVILSKFIFRANSKISKFYKKVEVFN